MTEFCIDSAPSKSNKTRQISLILLSNLYQLCSFIFLHPLCFSFVALFSPWLLKILSFLSPLFITTFLLLASPKVLHDSNRCHKAEDDEFQDFELDELQVYKTVFEGPAFETGQDLGEEPVDKCVIQGRPQAPAAEFEVKEGFLMENEVNKESIESDKSTRRSKAQVKTKRRSFEGIHRGGDEWPNVGRCLDSSAGGVRKEKEWKRTLAGKLYEERQKRGGEGMDMLWETESCKNAKKGYGDEDDDNEEVGVEICCLQALKLSAGKKMNTGIGRSSMVRFCKAVKGIGWLHHSSKKANR